MRRALKVLIALIFAVLPLLVVGAGLGTLWLSRSLAPAAGTLTVEGTSGPVTIARDPNGVPHVSAAVRNDVFTGLGLAHAQDRLWQMEVARMAAQGRLSEMFGEATLQTDIFLRTIAIYDASVASFANLPEEDRRALEAYAAGVNAWLLREQRAFSSRLPVEFVALGHEPEPWRPEDSVAVVKMMSVGLAANIGDEVNRLALARHGMTPAEIDELMPLLPEVEAPPLPDIAGLLGLTAPGPGEEAALVDQPFGLIEHGGLTGEGASNNWVVSGERTDTGLPILANDPHLGLGAPSIWYLAHLRVEEEGAEPQNLVGATLAGAPLVLLGRNDHVAWGFTNTGTDAQDLFVEQVKPDDPARYRAPIGWVPFGQVEEVITIAGGGEHRFTRLSTRHGPVLPDSYRNLGALLPEGTVGALRWTALSRDDTTMSTGFDLWEFETVADFQDGMRDFVTPMQSIVLADTSGDIGFVAPGRVPRRHPDNDVLGRAPVPGWDATYDWQGFIPYDALPRQTNPASGAIGTANTRIGGDDYEEMLTLDWDEAYRQRRVEELVIEPEAPHTMALSRAAQADVFSPAFADLMPRMLELAEAAEGGADPFVVALLKDWDHRMERDRPEPLIAMAFLREAMREIFADDLGAAFNGWFGPRAQVMDDVLNGRTERNWCDRVGTDEAEDCTAVMADALAAAIADLEKRFGDERSDWRWGKAHRALGVHQPFGSVEPLDRIFNVTVESGGGPFTLNRGRTAMADEDDPYSNRHAASFRAIYNLADLDRSTFMITTGQSGNVFSSHYRDLAEPWRDVEGIAIPTEPGDYLGDAEGVWQIVN